MSSMYIWSILWEDLAQRNIENSKEPYSSSLVVHQTLIAGLDFTFYGLPMFTAANFSSGQLFTSPSVNNLTP